MLTTPFESRNSSHPPVSVKEKDFLSILFVNNTWFFFEHCNYCRRSRIQRLDNNYSLSQHILIMMHFVAFRKKEKTRDRTVASCASLCSDFTAHKAFLYQGEQLYANTHPAKADNDENVAVRAVKYAATS